MIDFYGLKKCSTCQRALKWMDQQGIDITQKIDIREHPPSLDTLSQALQSVDGKVKKIMNTSGQDYRSMGLKDKVDHMTEAEILNLLSQHGMLVKRPLIVSADRISVGARIEDLENIWLTDQ